MWNLYTMRYTDINYLIVNIFHDRTESINKQNRMAFTLWTSDAIITNLILQAASNDMLYREIATTTKSTKKKRRQTLDSIRSCE